MKYVDKRELIEALVDSLPEECWPEIRKIVDRAIQVQRSRLEKLQKFSSQLSGTKIMDIFEIDTPIVIAEELDNPSAVSIVTKIIAESGRPIGNAEIRERYKKMTGHDIKQSTLGNLLWKHKGKKFKKSGGTRFAKWRIVSGEQKTERLEAAR